MKEPSYFLKKHPAVIAIAVTLFVLLSFVMGAYMEHITARKYSHISYYVLVETEKTENFTVYLPLPDLSPKETEDILNNFQPTSEAEFNNFSPFLNIGYNTSKISGIETEHGRMLRISAKGSVFLYSNIQANFEAASIFMSINKTHIFLNRTGSQGNITIKFFVFREIPKKGFFDYNYKNVEFCGLSHLQPNETERFTYLSELHFMHEAGATILKTGWKSYPVYNGSFGMCID